ncbi:DNA polymerase IV [Candidatus Giovannonibacteria bacterium]|nr:DNA polymerase IV [Candidatus Giovannonibacteria bacterium]
MRSPLILSSFPRAILHIDGDAFFAASEQARNPKLKGRPVITGKERGIVASMSYEAKARGVTRAMRLFEVKKICPDAVILPSDYETYSILSKRLFNIVRRYTPDVEEYGIDECFADITGLRRPFRMSYHDIAEKIKKELDSELGFTFSIGLAPNKVLAKIASKWAKPSGLTAIPGRLIHIYLEELAVEKVWGIGPQTTAFLAHHGIKTALDFALRKEPWIRKNLSKPFFEIWQELNGNFVLNLDTSEKTSYQSISKVKTFSPASNDRAFVFAQLSKNIENACMKARRYKLAANGAALFLRQENFECRGMEIKFSRKTAFAHEIINLAKSSFEDIFNPKILYRSTGVVLLKLEEENEMQLDLFGRELLAQKMTKIYESIDAIRNKYGKHTVFFGSSFQANKFSQHLGERGVVPQRKQNLLKGETARKRLAIPVFLGKIS